MNVLDPSDRPARSFDLEFDAFQPSASLVVEIVRPDPEVPPSLEGEVVISQDLATLPAT